MPKASRRSYAVVSTPPKQEALVDWDDALGGVMSAMHLLRRHVDDIWFALEESARGEQGLLSETERIQFGRDAIFKTLQRVLQVERELERAMDLCVVKRGE